MCRHAKEYGKICSNQSEYCLAQYLIGKASSSSSSSLLFIIIITLLLSYHDGSNCYTFNHDGYESN